MQKQSYTLIPIFLPYNLLIYENFFFCVKIIFFNAFAFFFIEVLKKFVNAHNTIVASRENIWKFFSNLFGRFGREAKSERR